MQEEQKRLVYSDLFPYGLRSMVENYDELYFTFMEEETPDRMVLVDDLTYQGFRENRLEIVESAAAFYAHFAKYLRLMHRYEELHTILEGKLRDVALGWYPPSTAILFPGNGAQQIRSRMDEAELASWGKPVNLNVQRKKDKTGKALEFDEEQLRDIQLQLHAGWGPERPGVVIVVDDVVHSGSTNRAIRNASGWEHSRWEGVSMIVSSPLMFDTPYEVASGVAGMDAMHTPMVVHGNCNMLSAVVKGGVKQEQKLQKLLERLPEERKFAFLTHYWRLHRFVERSQEYARR